MKKMILAASTLLFALGAHAQVKPHFGIKAGLNASELHAEGFSNKTKIGFHAGVFSHIHRDGSQWAFQPEVLYSLEGAKNKNDNDEAIDLHKVNVPLLAQYMFDNGFRVQAGPQVDFLVGAKYDGVDIKDQYKSVGLSIPVGIGYLTRSGLGFDARYNFGVTDWTDNGGEGNKLKGNTFQFGLFYQFSDPKMR